MVAAMLRCCGLALIACAMLCGQAAAKVLRSETAIVDGVELQVSAEVPESGLLVQEMTILTISASFRDPLNLFNLETTSFPNARALQLGKDEWSLEGISARALKRRIAVFPQKSGSLAIGPFRLDATVTTDMGGRRDVRLETHLLAIPVMPAPANASGWWLPVRSLSVKDVWDPDPQDVPVDGVAHRTVTIEAMGALGEQLPPVPVLRTPPVVTFARPETRETVVTPDGPLGRVTYRWDVRAAHDEPSLLEGIPIPWFDTTARAMNEARIPERRVAERLLLVKEETDRLSRLRMLLDWRAIVLGTGIGALALAVVMWRGRVDQRHVKAFRALSRAAAQGDARGVSNLIASNYLSSELDQGREAAALVAALDRHLHAAAAAPCPDLKHLVRCIRQDLSHQKRHEPAAASALRPLDASEAA